MATLYQTTDGKKFYTKNHAQNWAREAKLEDKTVKEVAEKKAAAAKKAEEPKKDFPLTWEEAKKAVEAAETREEVEKVVAENAYPSTVKAANARFAEFDKADAEAKAAESANQSQERNNNTNQ